MIHMFKRLLDFSAAERKKLILSFIFHMCNSVFEMLPIMAVLTVLNGIWCSFSNGHMPAKTIWVSFGIMLLSILGRILFTNLSSVKRTLGSFSMCSKWRMELGEKLKRVPMGYFNEHRLGDITAAVTTTLGDLETSAVNVMENTKSRREIFSSQAGCTSQACYRHFRIYTGHDCGKGIRTCRSFR